MEKFSKATKDFFKSIGEVKPPEEEHDVRDVARAARLIARPENLPKALVVYGLQKEAAKITEEIHPLELRDTLIDEYKAEWLDWTPENLDYHLLREQKSDIISNKAQALRVAMGTDTPWREWHIFENIGKAFNHQVPNFGLLQPLSVGECETTAKVLKSLRPEEEFEEEVLIYIATCCFTNHLVYIPKEWVISEAQHHLDNMIYDIGLKIKVKDAWERIKDKKLLDKKFNEDDAAQRQLADLTVIQQFIREYDGSYNRSASE